MAREKEENESYRASSEKKKKKEVYPILEFNGRLAKANNKRERGKRRRKGDVSGATLRERKREHSLSPPEKKDHYPSVRIWKRGLHPKGKKKRDEESHCPLGKEGGILDPPSSEEKRWGGNFSKAPAHPKKKGKGIEPSAP